MVGRAANSDVKAGGLPLLPEFERLAPPAPTDDLVSQIEAWTKPGEVVLDLTGRGGWVARAAIAEQRRAADFEAWPLTRLLAEVVLRPPDLRQFEAEAISIGAAPFSGTTVRQTIEALYASTCPRCGRSVTLSAMVWRPEPSSRPRPAEDEEAAAAAVAPAKPRRARKTTASVQSPLTVSLRTGELQRAVAREFRCDPCRAQYGGSSSRNEEPVHADVKLAASVPSSGDPREAMRRRFPAPRPTHPLVDELIDLHSPRQLFGLQAMLTRIEAVDRQGSLTAALRLAFFHAVVMASRLHTMNGRTSQLRIINGSVKVAAAREWREHNPWTAFEDGVRHVREFLLGLSSASPRSAVARLAVDLAALESGTSNAILVESTPAALRRLGLHGERMAHSGSPSRVKLVLGQAPLAMTPERLAALYHGTGWLFGPSAIEMLPYDALFHPAPRNAADREFEDLARGLGRALAIASPALSFNGRAVVLLDDDKPESLVAAALGGAAAGCRLEEARLHRGDDSSAGIAVFVPPTGTLAPGPRTRANRPLPPVLGGAGDPGTIQGRGVFAAPEKLDAGPFRPVVAAQIVADTAVDLLKARGEPATFEQMLGELLIGLDRSGQLARLARALRPPNADDGWSAWIADPADAPPDQGAAPNTKAGIRGGSAPRERLTTQPAALDAVAGAPGESTAGATSGGTAGATPGSAGGAGGHSAPAGPAGTAGAMPPPGAGAPPDATAGEAAPAGPQPATPAVVAQLLVVIREELDRPNSRRLRQLDSGQYWLASDDDRSNASQPLADRVEWAVFSLLSSAGHLTERAAIDRTAAVFESPDVPDGALIEACLKSYVASTSRPEAIVGSDQLERRTADHDSVIATLADVGHRLGFRVWIGKRQQARRVAGRALSAWLDPEEVDVHLPLITWAPEGELERVDCAWYVRRKATFLFEVEWTAMLGEPILERHARYPVDDRVVRFLVVPQERADLAKFKIARSPLLRRAIDERNWHFLKWNHLAAFAARPDLTLDDLEPYLGLDATADTAGEQLPLFGS
jgi:hypothetical protein